MNERPIIMSGDNPRLILEGRKTQTRRIVKPNPDIKGHWKEWTPERTDQWIRMCRYGVAGDRLWVRETLRRHPARGWYYSADGEAGSPITMFEDNPNVGTMLSWAHHKDGDTCPSIHMPRWASRITLEITKVRVERLRCITDADAMAEGMNREDKRSYSDEYHDLWDSLHGKGAWKKNPWVWVIEFKIDALSPKDGSEYGFHLNQKSDPE